MPQFTLIKLKEVSERTQLSRSEIYRRIPLSRFPAPVKIGARASAWSEEEIDAWVQARIAERDAKGVA